MSKRPRVDWKMIEKPRESCETCGEPIVAIACDESDECWELYWGCNNPKCAICQDGLGGLTLGEMDEAIIDWPFGDDETARRDDLSALGFERWEG